MRIAPWRIPVPRGRSTHVGGQPGSLHYSRIRQSHIGLGCQRLEAQTPTEVSGPDEVGNLIGSSFAVIVRRATNQAHRKEPLVVQ